MRNYAQLTQEQRYQIYALKKTSHNQTEIASVIGVHKSTVSREFKRNRGVRGYRPKQAHEKAIERSSDKVKPRLKASDWNCIEGLIKLDWSPDQIASRLGREKEIQVSHEWIYQHIYADKRLGGDLHLHLRCRKKRKKRYGSYDRRGELPNRVSIDKRPSVVDSRQRIGDWEGDTIIGKGHKGALVTLVDRKSLYTLIEPVERKRANDVKDRIVQSMSAYKQWVHTITFDNGKEFAEHEEMAKKLDARIYFAHPYASWERGVNENTNGLIRQYFPKTRNLTTVTRQEVEHTMTRLNNRPRKKLEYMTPYEIFFKIKTRLTRNVALNT